MSIHVSTDIRDCPPVYSFVKKGTGSPYLITERTVSVGFQSWSRLLAVSLQMTWVTNPAVGCHYFPPGPQLPAQPLRGLLPILLLGEQRHDGYEQFAQDCYPTASRLRFEPGPYCARVQHANHSATEPPLLREFVALTDCRYVGGYIQKWVLVVRTRQSIALRPRCRPFTHQVAVVFPASRQPRVEVELQRLSRPRVLQLQLDNKTIVDIRFCPRTVLTFGGLVWLQDARSNRCRPLLCHETVQRLPGVATATRRSETSASLSSSRVPTSTGQNNITHTCTHAHRKGNECHTAWGGSVAERSAWWTQAQKGLGSNRSSDAVG